MTGLVVAIGLATATCVAVGAGGVLVFVAAEALERHLLATPEPVAPAPAAESLTDRRRERTAGGVTRPAPNAPIGPRAAVG